MSKNIVNNLIDNITSIKEYCMRKQMTLVCVDVPPNIYYALEEYYRSLNPIHDPIHDGITGIRFDIERLCGTIIKVRTDIEKPRYIMETNDD